MRTVSLVATIWLIGCAAEVGPDRVQTTFQELRVDRETSPLLGAQGPGAAEQVAKRRGLPELILEDVDWDEAAVHERADVALMPLVARELLPEVSVPVLLPSNHELLASAYVARGEHWYTAQLDAEGFSVSIFGTRLARSLPSSPTPTSVISEDAPLITRSEGIPSISFRRFGVAYRLELECVQGPEDPRCSDFETLHETYAALVVAVEAE